MSACTGIPYETCCMCYATKNGAGRTSDNLVKLAKPNGNREDKTVGKRKTEHDTERREVPL